MDYRNAMAAEGAQLRPFFPLLGVQEAAAAASKGACEELGASSDRWWPFGTAESALPCALVRRGAKPLGHPAGPFKEAGLAKPAPGRGKHFAFRAGR